MSFLRPELQDTLHRSREMIAAMVVAALGLWLVALGGIVLLPIGGLVLVLSAIWGVGAWRRMRFAQDVAAPGVVELDEAQIGYLGPEGGGYVAIPDLVEIRLLRLRGRRFWQLRQSDGQALLIPVDAAGADRLYDAFAGLPGMDTGALLAVLAPRPDGAVRSLVLAAEMHVVWRRGPTGTTHIDRRS